MMKPCCILIVQHLFDITIVLATYVATFAASGAGLRFHRFRVLIMYMMKEEGSQRLSSEWTNQTVA